MSLLADKDPGSTGRFRSGRGEGRGGGRSGWRSGDGPSWSERLRRVLLEAGDRSFSAPSFTPSSPSSSTSSPASSFSSPSSWQTELEGPALPQGCARPGCPHALKVPGILADQVPRFAGREVCSRACLESLLLTSLRLGAAGAGSPRLPYRHRMPLGLLMLSRKWITSEQLSSALALQARKGHGRIGEWMVAAGVADETTVARALATQWGIPLMTGALAAGPGTEPETEPGAGSGLGRADRAAGRVIPRVLVDACGIAPLRMAAGRILYVAVEQPMDPCLTIAVERITGLRVEPVVVMASGFQRLRRNALATRGAPARTYRYASEEDLPADILAILDEQPTRTFSFARMREYVWLRLERGGGWSGWPGGGGGEDDPASGAVGRGRVSGIEDCILVGPRAEPDLRPRSRPNAPRR